MMKDGWVREWIYNVVLVLPTVAPGNEPSHPPQSGSLRPLFAWGIDRSGTTSGSLGVP